MPVFVPSYKCQVMLAISNQNSCCRCRLASQTVCPAFAAIQGRSTCSSKEEGYEEDYFPYQVCKEPAMHQLLVDVALGGAQAFIHSQRPSRMSHNVLLRIDIALTWRGDQVASSHLHWLLDPNCNRSPCQVNFLFCFAMDVTDVCISVGAGKLCLFES